MGCLSVNMIRIGGSSFELERIGRMTAYLSPICATDIHGRIVYLLDNEQKYLFDIDNKQLKTIK